MFCTKCGQEVKGRVQFCTNCGEKLFSQNSCHEFTPEEDKNIDLEREKQFRKEPENNQYGNLRNNKRNDVSQLAILTAVLIVVIILIAGACLFVFEKSDFNQPQDVVRNSESENRNKYYENIISDDKTVEQSQESVSETTQKEPESYMSDEERRLTEKMYALMDDNLYCVLEMYYFGNHLPTTGKTVGYNLVQVSSNKLSNYEAYENFIYSVYEKDYGFKKFINPCKYMRGDAGQLGFNVAFNENGEFYDNTKYDVDWSDYKLKIDSYSDRKCNFTVTASEKTSYGIRDYVRSGIATYQNGKWLLEGVIY